MRWSMSTSFSKTKPAMEAYLKELKSRTADLGVKNVLIMIDAEGHLADEDDAKRAKSIENHYKWVEAAKFLGCHSIRVNAYATSKDPEEGKAAAVDGLSRLTEFAEPFGIWHYRRKSWWIFIKWCVAFRCDEAGE
jgi:sugar phosphate isomerase/epimerase